jgi:Sortase domain
MPAYARIPSLAGIAVALIIFLTGAQPEPADAPAGYRPAAARGPGTVPSSIAAESFRSARTYPAVASPVRLRIPALHVDSRLDALGLQKDGSIAVPKRFDVAGWYLGGPRPGQPGPAVILGHVDSRTGPGIFVDLRTIPRGTLVLVDRTDGSSVTFRVTAVTQVPKYRFPTDLVYAPTLDPTLRLVTCGGSFDRSRGSYRDNVIAFADLV